MISFLITQRDELIKRLDLTGIDTSGLDRVR
jgi:hypothetical protein